MTRRQSSNKRCEGAFERAYREHHKRLFSFILRSVGRRESAEDILQEVFLRLAQRERLLTSGRDLRPWLYKVASSRVIDHYRSRAVQLEVPADGHTLDGLAGSYDSPEGAAMSREACRAVSEALLVLPYRERTAIMMRQYSGLSFAQVARAMGAPLGTVLSWVHRGLARLGDELRKQGHAPDDLLRG